MAIQPPSDLTQSKSRLTPNLADYLFVETHHANSPIVKSWDAGVAAGTITYDTPHPDVAKYPDHVLVYVSSERYDRKGDKVVDFYYAAINENQDEYNWVYTGYSGSQYKKFTRKYLIKRTDIDDEVAIPLNTADTVATDYVLFDTQFVPTGSKELDSVYMMRQSTYIKIEILEGVIYDPKLKENYVYEETIIFGDYDEALNNGGLNLTAPLLVTAIPINASWTRIYTRRRNDDNDFVTRSYFTYVNYSWPAVLKYFNIAVLNTKASYEGDEESFFIEDVRVQNSYSGPCMAFITEELIEDVDYTSPPTPEPVDEPMFPEVIQARGVFSGIGIRATLHSEITFTETRGTASKWNNGSTIWTFPATNYTDWPASLVVSSTVSPTLKGWMKKTITVYKPSV